MIHIFHTVTRGPMWNINQILLLSMVETAGAHQGICVPISISQLPLWLVEHVTSSDQWDMSRAMGITSRWIRIWCAFPILSFPSTCPQGDNIRVNLKLQDDGATRWRQAEFLSCLEEILQTHSKLWHKSEINFSCGKPLRFEGLFATAA